MRSKFNFTDDGVIGRATTISPTRCWCSFLRFALVFIVGLSTSANPDLPPSPREPSFPIIGVVSDSQFTTTNGDYLPGLREKIVDRVVETSIRRPAVVFLAPAMLTHFLNRLTNVDLILYLDDGANSGCGDELDLIFKTLNERRTNSHLPHVPIFCGIGNHDYPGLGWRTCISNRVTL